MKSVFPRSTWVFGLLLLLSALGYAAISGAALPLLDPTPEMRAREILQNHIIDTLAAIGGILLIFGLIWSALLRICAKKKPLNQSPLLTPAVVTPVAKAPVAPPPGAAGR